MTDESSQRFLAYWVTLLKEHILVAGVNEATVAALCGHLADLGVLAKTGEEDWQLVSPSDGTMEVEKVLEQRLYDLCASESGFALRYFLKNPPVSKIMSDSPDQQKSNTAADSKSNPQLLDQKTSNLSNLQLVRKYGRQVESFVELEKSYTEKLLGPHTTLKEARKIFNFMLSRMKQKTEPRSWEQLSRRRHK